MVLSWCSIIVSRRHRRKLWQRPLSLHPVTLDIDYPERLNRLTTAFRIILILPILGILLLISGPHWSGWPHHHHLGTFPFVAGGIIFLPTLLMILFRWKYPRWWFDWNVGIAKFAARVSAFLWLLTDKYPSTDEEQAVHINIPYPDVQKDLKAGLPLVKWFLAIPHYICLIGLVIGVDSRRHHRVVCNPFYREVSKGTFQLCRGSDAMGPQSRDLCYLADNRHLSTV